MHPILSTSSSLILDPCVPVPKPLFILFLLPPSLFSPCLLKGQILIRCTSVVSSPCPKLLVSFPSFLIPFRVPTNLFAAVTPILHGAYLYLCLNSPSTLLPKQIWEQLKYFNFVILKTRKLNARMETTFAATLLLNPRLKSKSPNSQTSPLLCIYLFRTKKHLLSARHFPNHFMYINSFNPHLIEEETQCEPK